MQEPNSPTLTTQTNFSFPSPPPKSEVEMRREKKKKMAAFKTFLGKIQTTDISSPLPVRKLSGDLIEETLSPPDTICKICNLSYQDKGKQCMFCNDTVCVGHIRKKRRNPTTNKFARICDQCEDKYLYKKHLKNEMKLQETLVAQQLLLEAKLKQLEQITKGKKIKLQVIKQKRDQLVNEKKKEDQKFSNQEEMLQKRSQRLTQRQYENLKLQNDLKMMQKKLPPSFQTDYQVLEEENEKITRELVIHEKLCQDVVKAFSQREKAMYEQYYAWEESQKQKIQNQKKQEECTIY